METHTSFQNKTVNIHETAENAGVSAGIHRYVNITIAQHRQPETNNEERGQEKSPTQTDQSKEEGEETEQHTERRAEQQPTNHDEGVMEEQEGFEEVTYGWNRRRQRQQVIIGTSRECEIKVEKKKAWIYLGRMTQETTTSEKTKRMAWE